MLLQWHVTDRCNLRCAHCYQGQEPGHELDHSALLDVLEQFRHLLHVRSRVLGGPVRGHVTLTGGEPFVRRDFMDLIECVAAESSWTSFAILCNGSFVDEASAAHLANLGPAFVQVSVDGTEGTHDAVRGNGNFRRTTAAVRSLVKAGIRTLISFTAHSDNYKEFAEVARLACDLGAARVWADRLVPSGRGEQLQGMTLAQTRELFAIMRRARDEARRRWFCSTNVAMHRALQFQQGGGQPYRCRAGDTLLTIMPNGDLVPCRRMPICVGNVTQSPLHELYDSSKVLRALRDPRRVCKGCGTCEHREQCRGGLRCLSYATTGSPFVADPGCSLASARCA